MQPFRCFVIVCLLLFGPKYVYSQGKSPVPSKQDQDAAAKLVREVYKADYATAKSPAARLSLAQKLLKQGIETNDNPTGKFVLFQQALDLAIDVGAVGVIFESWGQMAETFAVEEDLLIDSLTEASKLVKPVKPSPHDLSRVMQIVEEGVDIDDFDLSLKYLPVAAFIGRNLGPESSKAVSIRSTEIEQLRKAYPAVKDAREKLEAMPDDPEACLIVGKYLCFLDGEWESGLKLLAKCSNPMLKSLAERDLSDPKDAKDWVEIGDGWWGLAETSSGLSRAHLATRAEKWYLQAQKSVTGLTAARLDQRLKEVKTLVAGTSLSHRIPESEHKFIAKKGKGEGGLSVWGEPSPIVAGHSYEIVIQVRVPADMKVYRPVDLTGMVIGTDGYKQAIRFPKGTEVPVKDGMATIRVRVPGADPGVRNSVRVESRMLGERQSVELK